MDTFRRRRESELKNGRVAMFATIGCMAAVYGHTTTTITTAAATTATTATGATTATTTTTTTIVLATVLMSDFDLFVLW